MNILGAELVIECLRKEGVEIVFGYPGSAVLTLYDALFKSNFFHVLTCHEQGAIHAADGYARATGRVGVCIATSGPGATNLITGIANAYMDSIPLVAITGQVGVEYIGKDSFQEADICGITAPITKHNYLVKKVQDLPQVLKESFYIARTGRPGPVVIDISKDVFNDYVTLDYPDCVQLKGYSPINAGDPTSIDDCLKALKQAQRPLLFIGGGVSLSDTYNEVRELAQLLEVPIIVSLMGLGCISYDTPYYLGMVGMHGTYSANMAVSECDLLIGLGVRFDDRVTGIVKSFAAKAKIVHFDIDPAEINKNIYADLKVIGDLRWSLPLLCEKAKTVISEEWHNCLGAWRRQVEGWQQPCSLSDSSSAKYIRPQAVIKKVYEFLQDETIVVTDVGQHQMWTAQYYNFRQPRSFITSGGLGTMGFGLPAAVGAQLGRPDSKVVLFTGDGSIMMNCQELATVAELELPIKIIILNNKSLGLVAQWQRLFYGKRYSQSKTKQCIDFLKIAQGMGISAFRVENQQDMPFILENVLQARGPVLVDILIGEDENVFPMVPPGKNLNQMIFGL